MKNKASGLVLLVLLSLQAASVNASCDPCITAAAVEAGAAQVAAIGATTAAVEADVAATEALTAAVEAANTAITTQIELSTNNILTGLDASTKTLQGEMTKSMMIQQRLSDVKMQNMTQIMKDVVKANAAIQNERTFGDRAMPKSGDIGAERAGDLEKASSEVLATIRKLQEDFYKWMNDPEMNQSGATRAKASTLLGEKDEVWDPVPMLTKNIMTMEESKDAQKLIIAMVNHHPQRPLTPDELAASPDAVDIELKRRVSNARDMIAHEILAKRVVNRMPLVPISEASWGTGYVKAQAVDGKTSIEEMYRTEIEGRLTSEQWHLDVKTLTEAGLLREQVYLQAIRNKMLLEIMDQENKEGLMMALEQQ